VFRQPEPPVSTVDYTLRIGDVWHDENDNNKVHYWNGTTWLDNSSAVSADLLQAIEDAQADADAALEEAEEAMAFAVASNRVFRQATAPGNPHTDGYALRWGDAWINDDNLLHTWNGTTWVSARDAMTTAANTQAGVAAANATQALSDAADAFDAASAANTAAGNAQSDADQALSDAAGALSAAGAASSAAGAAQTAAGNALTAAAVAQTSAVRASEADWMNLNPTFANWTGTTPANTFPYGSPYPTKETGIVKASPNAVRYNVTAANTDAGLGWDATGMAYSDYYTVEVDFYLASGGLGGAGVLVDWNGMTDNRAFISLGDYTDSVATGKWYRVTKTVKKPDAMAGTWTSTSGYLMANYGWGLGTISAKDIIFGKLGVRVATAEEVTAYDTPGAIATAQATAISTAATDAATKAATAQSAAIAAAAIDATTKANAAVTSLNTWTRNLSGGMVEVAPGTFRKTGGNQGTWDGHLYSSEGHANGASMTVTAESDSAYYMIGLADDPSATPHYSGIDFAWYAAGGTWYIYENGVDNIGAVQSLFAGDTIAITHDGSHVRYYLNNVLKRTVARGVGSALHLDSSFYNFDGTGVKRVQFGRIGAEALAATAQLKTIWGHPADENQLNGRYLYSQSVLAQSLLIGDFTNYIADAEMEDPLLGSWETTGSPTRGGGDSASNPYYLEWIGGNGTNNHIWQHHYFGVKQGDKFHFSAEVSTPDTNTQNVTVVPSLASYDGAGNLVTWPQLAGTVLASNTGWTPIEGVITISGANEVQARFDPFANGAAAGQKVRMRKMVLRRMYGGNLLVDGAIDGKTVTGALLRTAATGPRVVMDGSGLVAYDGADVPSSRSPPPPATSPPLVRSSRVARSPEPPSRAAPSRPRPQRCAE
jgi:hypothetical protein